MKDLTILKERTRRFSVEGREFIVHYQYVKEPQKDESDCVIRACLKVKADSGQEEETVTSIKLSYQCGKIGERIFDLIANAPDPVLPVHLPDIVRDEMSAALILEESFNS